MAIMCQPHHTDKEGAMGYYSTYVKQILVARTRNLQFAEMYFTQPLKN